VALSENRHVMRGGLRLERRAGIEAALVATDVQRITRTSKAIRQDQGENYFLILQEEGRALMRQNDTTCLLRPGDFVLIDSAVPSEFVFSVTTRASFRCICRVPKCMRALAMT
jgi:AraC family transcriptional regulator, positive regulator of tynA and feaB